MADEEKIKLEDYINPTDSELRAVGNMYSDFYKFRNQRSGSLRQLQYQSFEDYLKTSRLLFWNSTLTASNDLKEMGLEFAFPFVRKEVLDFVGRLSSLNIAPSLSGESLSMFGVKVLNAMYKKWRLKSKDRVEKFWQTLYGVVNGTVCLYVGFDNVESQKRFLKSIDHKTGEFQFETKNMKMWDDVKVEVVPIEEMYLAKIWQRNIQFQGKTIRKKQMTLSDFQALYPKSKYPNAEFVVPGSRIAEDSLYFELLGGSNISTTDMIEVFRMIDTDNDKDLLVAGGVALNMLGKGKKRQVSPNPFHHKMQPYIWSMFEPIDEKFAYGLSMPFKLKDPHKLMNTSYTLLVEQELRAIDPPYLTSDIEAPELIFGQKKVIPVMDVNAYKPIDVREASGSFYTMLNSLQGVMSSHAQGGAAQLAPSRQPKAAREIIAMENMKQQALGNTLVMYFDLIYQEIFLMLKTALQFYEVGKYANQKENLIRAITVPEFPLTKGGIGRLEVRVVKKTQNALKLYFEAVNKSIENGKQTEIIEIPVDSLNKLDFFIDDIKLEPEINTELERATWNENVLKPLLEVWIPMGLADPAKSFLRWAEKNNEHISNFASDQQLPQIMQAWGNKYKLPADIVPNLGRQNTGQQTGNLLQSTTGTRFGSQSAGGFPELQMEGQ